MVVPIADELIQKVHHVAELYHRLVLIVGPTGTGKTTALQKVQLATNAPLINVNLDLSREMLELTQRQRALQLPRLLSEIVTATNSAVVLFDNIEMIFDVSLQQDPLRLMLDLSRNTTIVAAWNGNTNDHYLTYASPGHPEYRQYPLRGFVFVCAHKND